MSRARSKSRSRLLRLAAGIALVVTALVGCGGDDGLTREEYVASLNALCENYAAEHERIGEPASVADIPAKVPRIIAAFESLLEKASALDPPEEVADEARRMHAVGEEQLQVLRGLVRAARALDYARLQALVARNGELNAEANSVARELGATSCAE